MGVDEAEFYEGCELQRASKDSRKLPESKTAVAYKDFAHSPE
jgi:UDP-N-acetylmuramate: L-alanyl-gamma-D-glutamyl-meso-diaminopimelate ligase